MKILIACEFSGIVREAFTKLGHDVTSCDLLPTEIPGKHYQGDVRDILYDGWEMMIAFPPCTHLAVAGAMYFEEKRKDGRQQEAIDFFLLLANAPIKKIAIENPIGIIGRYFRKPDQIIQPYFFGDAELKTTCLWLKNIPFLLFSEEKTLFEDRTTVDRPQPNKSIVRKSGAKAGQLYNYYWRQGKSAHDRSRTFPGIANAMAQQWGRMEVAKAYTNELS